MVKIKLVCDPSVVGFALGLAMVTTALPSHADEVLSDPSPCEISARLGVQAPDCPAGARSGAQGNDEDLSRGLTVGNSGPLSAAQPGREYRAAFKITFKFGSAQLTEDAKAILGRIGTVLSAPDARDMTFKIVGHTDSVGAADTNQRLSEARAAAVREYLVRTFHLTPDHLSAEGMGSRQPFTPANPRAAENRRVEVINLGRRP